MPHQWIGELNLQLPYLCILIFGDALIRFGRRETYSPQMYFDEVGNLIQTINANANIPVKNNLIGPSVASGDWTPEMVWETNFIPTYANNFYALAVEQ